MKLVIDEHKAVAAWVADRLKHVEGDDDFGPCKAIGVASEVGELIGGVVYSNYRPSLRSMDISVASSTPRWLTRPMITYMLNYPFYQVGCVRVTAITGSRNKATIRFLHGLGFYREGVVRKGLLTEDAMLYGMLEKHWRTNKFNTGRLSDGQERSGSGAAESGDGCERPKRRKHRNRNGAAKAQHDQLDRPNGLGQLHG